MVVEVLGGHQRVRARHRVTAPGPEAHCTVGRSATCDVVLDDPFVAAVHAQLTVDADGLVTVTDLDSVNGVEIDGRRLHGVQRVPLPGGVLRVGRTRLRVRTAHEVVAPEQADLGARSWPARAGVHRLLAAGLTVTVATTVFEVWTATERPRDLSTALVTTLLVVLALAGLWISLWALATRVAFGESRWTRHAEIVFAVFGAVSVLDLVGVVANGAFGLHLPWSVLGPLVLAVAAAVALVGHLRTASAMRTRVALGVGLAIPAVIVAVALWMQARSQNRSASHIEDRDHVVPPALVLRRPVTLDAFADQLAGLKATADARRAFVEREDPSPAEDDAD